MVTAGSGGLQPRVSEARLRGKERQRNSPDIYSLATVLKHVLVILCFSTRPSNREGFKDSFGGLRAVLIFWELAILISDGSRSFQVSTNQVNQVFSQLFRRLHLVIWIHHVQADMVLKDLSHQPVNSTTDRGQQHQDVGAFISGSERALDGRKLAANPLDAEEQLLFLFRNFGNFILHFVCFLEFFLTIPKGDMI